MENRSENKVNLVKALSDEFFNDNEMKSMSSFATIYSAKGPTSIVDSNATPSAQARDAAR